MKGPRVKVVYYGLLATVTGVKDEAIDLEDGANVGTLLKRLTEKYGDRFSSKVMARDGTLLRSAQMWVDGVEIRDADGRQTTLRSGNQVSVVVFLHSIRGG